MFRYALALTALLTVPVEAATVLVSNLTEPTSAGNTTLVDIDLWAAQSFITDGNAYRLVDVATVLGEAAGGPPVVAELRKDTTTGALLTVFAVPSLTGPLSARTLTPAAPVTLDANTTYWLILGVPGAGSFGWNYAEGNNFAGPGEMSAYGYSMDQGTTWVSGSFDFPDPYRIRVNVDSSAVPEPSTLASSVAALLVAMALRLRRA